MSDTGRLFVDSLGTAADVAALVSKAEDLYFEAKTCSEPFSEVDQGHLAEAVSGFANADGGVLIYGLVAAGGGRDTPDMVTRVEHVKKLDLVNSRVLSLIGQLVDPPVPNVQVVRREFDRLPNQGFLLVYVPPSDLGPHRSRKDREYYRRHGHGFFRMEHFEIAEMFGRRRSPALELFWNPYPSNPCIYMGTSQQLAIKVTVGLRNNGRAIAKYPALLMKGVTLDSAGLDGCGSFGLQGKPNTSGALFAGGMNDVVYPNTELQIATIKHQFPSAAAAGPWAALEFDYEIFAENMPTIKGTLRVDGTEMQDLYGTPKPIVWPAR